MKNNLQNSDLRDDLDAVLVKRLRQLGTIPVDTSNVDKALGSLIPVPYRNRKLWIGSMSGLAAAAVAALAIIVALMSWPTPVQASPRQLATLYHQLTGGTSNPAMAAMGGMRSMNMRTNGGPMPFCCAAKIGTHRIQCCMYLRHHLHKVLVVQCSNREMQPPAGQLETKGQSDYTVTKHGNINMAMLSHNGRWTCAMGPQAIPVLEQYLRHAAAILKH